jgi:hypothetical protein
MDISSFGDYWAPYIGQENPGAEPVASIDEAARIRLHDEDGLRSWW